VGVIPKKKNFGGTIQKKKRKTTVNLKGKKKIINQVKLPGGGEKGGEKIELLRGQKKSIPKLSRKGTSNSGCKKKRLGGGRKQRKS